MISADSLATLKIRKVIFHDLPRKLKGAASAPTLSDIDTEIDPVKADHLKGRMTRALKSHQAFEVQFKPETPSPTPQIVRAYTAGGRGQEFVESSKQLARYLADMQTGAMSAGLLTVMDCAVGARRALAVLKLEREEGAQIERGDRSGKKTFTMSVLDNLVLTQGTRLFKTGLFIRTGPGEDDFEAAACDDQRGYGYGEELALFWTRFLGCKLKEEPRVITRKVFEAVKSFIHESVPDPVLKNDLYEHIVSELKAERRTFSPKSFIQDYVPQEYKQELSDYLVEQAIPLTQFPKDISEIAPALRRKALHTARGVTVSVPLEESERVQVEEEQIVIADTVTWVDSK